MKCREEEFAREAHRSLSQHFADNAPETRVAVQGAGVHWDCTAERGDRFCKVHCFDTGSPEYLIAFRREAEMAAWGRTWALAEVLAAVSAWLAGKELEDVYRQFAFVDRRKRQLLALAAEAVQHVPELSQAGSLRPGMCDSCELWFTADDRTCRIVYYGRNDFPDALFHWDECEMFRVRTGDVAQLAHVLKRWLCDRAAPSAMKANFAWIEMKKVAQYYEEGRPIEGEFLASWDATERFYKELKRPGAKQVRRLVAQMRQAGYDTTLRAGQSLWVLIVSRSRRHGLRTGQPCISFLFRDDKGMDMDVNLDGAERIFLPQVELTPQVDALLQRLAARDID